ncbi:MAG: DegT/DnrJ/EryC1/StrS aminotransferase family protein, partial [Clostridia bacterium]|nr:DegT/DnrJ/EryC1/StrS aminotransferase family protein [Clostridia bacterium]
MNIPFSPPDITKAEIDAVAECLTSGWITTGPKTKSFENRIASYCRAQKAVCLNSATAGLELTLRILGIGEGDEVITSAYTYTASASVIAHVGAKIVLCDIGKEGFEIDYDAVEKLITPKTKAIIAVDIAGKMCDYPRLIDIA